MLVRLYGRNFGAFRDRFELSLEATDLPSEAGRGYFEIPIRGESKPLKLLRLLGIYGPNASGKSTVIRAASVLYNLVVNSGPSWQEDKAIPHYDPFLLSRDTRDEPVELGCEVVVKDTVIDYCIHFTNKEVCFERITERRDSGDIVWLDRSSASTFDLSSEQLSKGMSIELDKVTRRNAAAISTAAQLNQTPLLPLFHELKRSLRFVQSEMPFPTLTFSLERLSSDPEFSRWTLDQLIKPADIGIESIDIEKKQLPEELLEQLSKIVIGDELEKLRTQTEATFLHQGVDGAYALSFGDESAGTQKMLALAGPWYDVAKNGLTVFVDELSANLHPSLFVALLEALNPAPGRRPSQLVFTSHDLTAMEGVLRRDQIFFTEKSARGCARLFPLSDFALRNEHNLRKRYLEGRYGALPHTPPLDLFEEDAVGE